MLFARQVLSYLRDMKDLASSSEFDESIFQTLLLIGKSIAVRFSDNPELRTLANKLDSNLDSFNPLWQLCTGLSMEVLWKTFRPPLAKNIIQVESRLQVEALANRFDNLKWKVDTSIFELDSLRRSIILLHNTIESTNAGENDSLDVSEYHESHELDR